MVWHVWIVTILSCGEYWNNLCFLTWHLNLTGMLYFSGKIWFVWLHITCPPHSSTIRWVSCNFCATRPMWVSWMPSRFPNHSGDPMQSLQRARTSVHPKLQKEPWLNVMCTFLSTEMIINPRTASASTKPSC